MSKACRANNQDFCLREVLNYLMTRAYTWYVNLTRTYLILGHLNSLLNAKSFCVESKFILAELRKTSQFSSEYLDACIRRFHERAMEVFLVAEDLLLTAYMV